MLLGVLRPCETHCTRLCTAKHQRSPAEHRKLLIDGICIAEVLWFPPLPADFNPLLILLSSAKSIPGNGEGQRRPMLVHN